VKAPSSKIQAPEISQDPNIEAASVAEAVLSTSPSDSKWKWYLVTLLLFVLGLLSKPMLVTLPCVLLLIDFWPLNRFSKDAVRGLMLEKIPFFALSAVFSVITFFSQKKDSLVVDFATLPLNARLANSVVSYARYIAKTLWPDSLAAYYPMVKWQVPQVVLATVLFVGISALATSMVRRRPWIFVGWFWFAGLLFPVIGISQVAMQSMADRFSYLPHIGLFIFVVWSVFQLPVQTAKIALSALCAGALALAGISAHQVKYWKDSEALFRHIIAVTPENDITEYYMGMILLAEKHDLAGARYHFERTLKLNPKYSGAYMRLGDILVGERKLDEAEQKYREAVRAEPNATICNLKLAKLLAQKRSVDEAIEHYRVALHNRPEIAEAQYQLGQLLNDKHDVAGAIGAFQQAVLVKPDWTEPLNDLAWALATQNDSKLRDGSKAVQLASRAAELTHRSAPGILDTLAAAYAEAGRFDDAVATTRDAIQRAQALGATSLVNELEGRLKLYQAKQPYRE
jgi:tetratricopeptide (TPR) repeat protein